MFTMGWSVFFLTFVSMMFSILIVQQVTVFLAEEKDGLLVEDPATEEGLVEYFGSVYKSLMSLFKATTGGNDWDTYYGPLKKVGFVASLAFIVYIVFSIV